MTYRYTTLIIIFSGIVCIAIPFTIDCRRNSRQKNIEGYKRRSQAAAATNTPVKTALRKLTKNMSFDEAVLAKQYYLNEKDMDMVSKCSMRLLAVGGDQNIMRLTRLELAEHFLDQKNYPEAEKYAQEYLTYYPGADESKKARYIALNATYLSQAHSDKDQQKTKATITLAKEFLEKYPEDSEHVTTILNESYLKLIRNEINIINTQLNTYTYAKKEGSLVAANKRVAYIKDHYLPHTPHAKKRVLELEITLAQAGNNTALTRKKKAELSKLTTHPKLLVAKKDTSWTQSAWHSTKDFFVEDNTRYFA